MARIVETYSQKESRYGMVCKKMTSFFVGKFGLFLLVLLYCIVGAALLISLETDKETERINTKKSAHQSLINDKTYIVDNAWYLKNLPSNETEFKEKIRENIILFRTNVIKSHKNDYYDGRPEQWTYAWTFPNSLLFTVTTVGSIGYGHIAPKTWVGQLFTIYYGMVGIPLLLLFLAKIGDIMANSLRYVYSRLCCRWCRARRKLSDYRKKSNIEAIRNEEVGQEFYMPTEKMEVPIMVNLGVIVVYLVFGGLFFSYSEEWDIHEASYFSFITLTTIGFGDYVPGRIVNSRSVLANFMFVINICYCVFGMALLSMAITLMQRQIVQKTVWFAQEMGIMEENVDKVKRDNIRYADESDMLVTADDYKPYIPTDKKKLLHNAHDDGNEYSDGDSVYSRDY